MRWKLLNGKMIGMLAVFLALFVAVGIAEEERTDASGQWRYVLKDGGATITGYVEEPTGDLVIPSELDGYSVKRLGNRAFAGCNSLASVTIPDGVTDIGEWTFDMCNDLTSVSIPESLTSIGFGVFAECVSLTNVIIPHSVTSFDIAAFLACYSLTDITIPESVTSIGGTAFMDCSNLTSLTIPSNVVSIGGSAFDGCDDLVLTVEAGSYAQKYAHDNNIPYISIGDAATDIITWEYVLEDGGAIITGCSGYLQEPSGDLVIPDELDGYAVVRINNNAFAGRSGLTSVTIPNSVTSIGLMAFRSCTGLISVTIPDSVTSIIAGTFSNCSNLTTFIIPNSVTSIGNFAFEGCDTLTSLTIPSTVVSIRDTAFQGCENLVLTVDAGSYAKQYAQENGIPYVLAAE